jgi:hypothetical protein
MYSHPRCGCCVAAVEITEGEVAPFTEKPDKPYALGPPPGIALEDVFQQKLPAIGSPIGIPAEPQRPGMGNGNGNGFLEPEGRVRVSFCVLAALPSNAAP